MNSEDFRNCLQRLKLSQADLARLFHVTSRTVNLWATDKRVIPGSVIAYLKLLDSLPEELFHQEYAKIKLGK